MQRHIFSETGDVAELFKDIGVEFWPHIQLTGKRDFFSDNP